MENELGTYCDNCGCSTVGDFCQICGSAENRPVEDHDKTVVVRLTPQKLFDYFKKYPNNSD